MSVTKEGSSCEAGDKLPVPGASGPCIVSTDQNSQPGDSNSQEWESATSRNPPSGGAMRRVKALPDCVCKLPCTAVGARLLGWLVTAKVPQLWYEQ